MGGRLLAAALACAAAISLASCSDDPGGDPGARSEVVEAVRALADPDPSTIEVQLPYATAEDLHGLSIGITPERAEAFEGASFTIKNDYASDPLEAHFSMKLELAAGSVEARQIEDDLYLRGDLVPLARSMGEELRPFVRSLARKRAFRALVPVVLGGRWVHVFGAREAFSYDTGGGRGRAEVAAAAFATAVEEGAAVTAEGSDDAGSKYRVEIHLARFAEALVDAAEGLIPNPPPPEEIEAAGDARLSLDVWVEDGVVRRVEVDVSELIALTRGDAALDREPLIMRFDVRPFDTSKLVRPKPRARLHALALARLLFSAGGAP